MLSTNNSARPHRDLSTGILDSSIIAVSCNSLIDICAPHLVDIRCTLRGGPAGSNICQTDLSRPFDPFDVDIIGNLDLRTSYTHETPQILPATRQYGAGTDDDWGFDLHHPARLAGQRNE
jgi:hypothetical protein